MPMGGGKTQMWSHVPLCHAQTERPDWQLAGRGGEHAKSPGSLRRGTGLGPTPLWASALWTSLPLLLCHEIAPAAHGCVRASQPCQELTVLSRGGSGPPVPPLCCSLGSEPWENRACEGTQDNPAGNPPAGAADGSLWYVLAWRLPKPASHSCLPLLLVKLLLEQLTPQISPIWSLGATVLQLRRCASPWAVSHHQLHRNQLKKMLPAQKVK